MPIRLVTDDGDTEDLGDVDIHFYEKQVAPSGPFGDNAFALAAARAKDRARVKLIKAVRKADEDAQSKGFGTGLAGFEPGLLLVRTVDGVEGAPDDAIKL